MNAPLFIGLVLAVARVTRLLVVDELPLVKKPRDWIIRTFWSEYMDEGKERPATIDRWRWFWKFIGHSFAYVWTCAWCMSIYVGLGVWGLADWRLSVPYPWLMIAAGSLLSGWLGNAQAEHDQRFKLRQRDIEEP